MKEIKAVIFDVDGTLVDSMWIWKKVDIAFLEKRGIALPEEMQTDIEGLSYTETAMYFKDRFSLSESVEDIKEEWRIMAEELYRTCIPLKSGVLDFLNYIKNKGKKIGIATSNSREIVECMLERHNIKEYFSSIWTSCEVPRSKPFPDVYLKVAEDLEVAPAECLAFEDTVAGTTAALSAGMRVIVVADESSANFKEKLKKMAQGYIYGFEEMMGVFG